MAKLFLSRHAESLANKEGWISSWTDVPLSQKGREQAGLLAKELAQHKLVNGIYCSDLRRAHETASIVAESLGLSIRTDEGLRERHFGEWTGKSFAEVNQNYEGGWKHIFKDDDLAPPGGESLRELHQRVCQAVERGLEIWPDGFVIISHFCSIGTILGRIEGKIYSPDKIPRTPPAIEQVIW